jgi:hypothetical protein
LISCSSSIESPTGWSLVFSSMKSRSFLYFSKKKIFSPVTVFSFVFLKYWQ